MAVLVFSISIHALREEGDDQLLTFCGVFDISIHALREEGDCPFKSSHETLTNFYPRPPRGGRRQQAMGYSDDFEFLSTPSARRATKSATLAMGSVQFLSTPSARRATTAIPAAI